MVGLLAGWFVGWLSYLPLLDALCFDLLGQLRHQLRNVSLKRPKSTVTVNRHMTMCTMNVQYVIIIITITIAIIIIIIIIIII